MATATKPPKSGKGLGKTWHGVPIGVLVAGGGVVVVVGYEWYKKKKAAAATASSSTGAQTPAASTASTGTDSGLGGGFSGGGAGGGSQSGASTTWRRHKSTNGTTGTSTGTGTSTDGTSTDLTGANSLAAAADAQAAAAALTGPGSPSGPQTPANAALETNGGGLPPTSLGLASASLTPAPIGSTPTAGTFKLPKGTISFQPSAAVVNGNQVAYGIPNQATASSAIKNGGTVLSGSQLEAKGWKNLTPTADYLLR